ncbi:MAG: leucyl/phenylalanyl-tRNA--protein transferase [Oligoflexia bacterium]|nr:leucyl/phenylalanyl-tRNA--protein transferase [Oligoflexia bacterium]
MAVTKFPDPDETDEDGILAWGGDLEPETLLLAYSQGIFPWPLGAHLPLAWFCPPRRAILHFDELHVPRSLERARRQSTYRFTVDQAFERVVRACASQPRPGQRGTWITRPLIAAYVRLHHLGHAHSVEVWQESPGEPALIGGIYGVDAGGAFAGESMFHARPNASKLALLHLVDHLRSRGLDWLDIQVMTPHLQALGARELSRDDFLRRLARTRSANRLLFPKP